MEAKTTEWRPGPTVCRCCLTEGCYKDISTEYFWMGKREVYSEMLSETLDLNIAYSQSGGPNSNSRLICEPCISRLRDATDFKRQVLECERSFMQYLDPVGSGDIGVNIELDKDVKIERVKDEKTLLDDDDEEFVPPEFGDGDEDDDDLDDQPLTKLASKIPKKESVDVLDLLDNAKITEKRKSSSKSKSSPAKKSKLKKEVASSSKVKPEPRKKKESTKEVQATSKWSMTLPERKNAAYLLQYTTVTPFTYMIFPSGYKCLYCDEKFTELQNVLSHTRKHDALDHTVILKDILKKGKKKIKVDISLLKCRICDEQFYNLETVQRHLTDIHEKNFLNAGNGMFVFSLEEKDEVLTCHICSSNFHSFFLLNKHMSVHFSNAVCESCGKGFLSYHRLLTHMKSHRNGTYPCKSCKKVFPSITKLKYHTSKFHGDLGRSKFAKCQKCSARFEHHYEKINHLKAVHGLTLIFKCEICFMEFQSRQNMNLHIVKCHGGSILCRFCEQSFSDRYHLRKHILTHAEPKSCHCPVCRKQYKSEKNLKYHMKYAHGPDWKYFCRICRAGFASKDDFKTHKISHI